MKRGFTVLELLVASLLLGMLVTILTMVFNQSSIAWRTGVAGMLDMDEVRDNIAEVRDDADSLYVWNRQMCRTVSIWKEGSESSSPQLKDRAIIGESGGDVQSWELVGGKMRGKRSELTGDTPKPEKAFGPVDNLGQSDSMSGVNYIVNVRSCGPNRRDGDYDDIWSNEDDFD